MLYIFLLWAFPVFPAHLEESLQDWILHHQPLSTRDLLTHVWVDIDDQTIETLGEPPRWDRKVWVTMLQHLEPAHPRRVSLDVLFIHPHPEDSVVVRSLLQLPFTLCLPGTGILTPPTFWLRTHALHTLGYPATPGDALSFQPTSHLSAYAPLQKGFVEVLLDPDGVLRHPLPLRLKPLPARLPFATCGKAPEGPLPDQLPYFEAKDLLRVSFLDVLRGRVPPETFHKKYVWVGASAQGLHDNIRLHGTSIPGVLAHIALFMAGEGEGWVQASSYLFWLHTLMLFALMGLRRRWLWFYFPLSYSFQLYTLQKFHWIWPQILPMGLLVVMGGTLMVRRFLDQWKERHRLMDMFRMYVSDRVLRDLLHHPSPDPLKPRIRKLVVMFVDLRGFTSFTERSSPKEVEAFLNQYYTLVADIVHQHQGTVSKFIGDGVLVVFGDPNPLPDQCCTALKCALDLLINLSPLVIKHGLDIGISLHQGEALLGHFGSARRREYSVFGDVVNTASRMEALNKKFRTRLIFSKPFVRCAQNVRFLGQHPIRGKSSPLNLYTLPETLPSQHEFNVSSDL